MTVEVVDIRDLDGPNLFRLEPVVKIGLVFAAEDDRDEIVDAVMSRIVLAHDLVDEPRPTISSHTVDHPDEIVIAFDWRWRRFALGTARFAADFEISSEDVELANGLKARLQVDRDTQDAPEWVRDSARTTRCVGITGTNGKTTTTRLLAHIAQCAGRRVGWSSSTGVYIQGVQVLDGDYSGPSGARRVLQDPDVEFGMLETARGGLLLRGLAYESNDVSVFLNVSADHLSLQGVETLKTLADVKGVVVRVTRSDGLVVLNADDPFVLAFRDRVRSSVLLFSRQPDNAPIQEHISAGGSVIVRDGDLLILKNNSAVTTIAGIGQIPIAFGGAAPFMVDNAMAAAGAALGLGFSIEQIEEGLTTFRSDSASNKGRLNIFDVDGRTVIIDYAHNDTGLRGLANFARRLSKEKGLLHLAIGTAGDRRDEDFLALGRIARELGDVVYLKDTPEYLRGRERGAMPALMREGFDSGHGSATLAGAFKTEASAFVAALSNSSDGDTIAVMCQVDQDRMIEEIESRGGRERTQSL